MPFVILFTVTFRTSQFCSVWISSFGDSYKEPISSVEEMKHFLKRVADSSAEQPTKKSKSSKKEAPESSITREEILELEAELFDRPPRFALFRACKFYIARIEDSEPATDSTKTVAEHELEREQIEFQGRQLRRLCRLHGGLVSESLTEDVTHVLVLQPLLNKYSSFLLLLALLLIVILNR